MSLERKLLFIHFFFQHRLLNVRPHGNAGLISGCSLEKVTDATQYVSDCVQDLSSS